MGYSETESEEIQRLAHFTIEQASDMIFWVDRQARLYRVNEAVCKTLGYSREELSLMTVHDIDAESTPETWEEFWGDFKKDKIQQFESCLVAKDGREIPAEVRVYSVESDGRFFVCAFVRDITEQKRREFAQRLSQFTIEKAGDLIYWIDSEANFKYANQAACDLMGYTREEFLSMKTYDVDPNFPPEEFQQRWRALKEEGSILIQTSLQAKEGRMIPVEISANLIEFEGKEYACSFVRDITERKSREFVQRFSHFTIDRAGDLIYWIDSDANFKHVNQAACDLMGYTREEFMSMKTYDIDPDNPPEEFQERWQRLKETGVLVFVGRRRTKDGRMIPLEISSNFIEFEGKEYACGFARDISERLNTQQKLARLNRDKERIEAELNLARQIQESFLSTVPPCYDGFCFAAKSLPARFVGGDFFDFIPLDDQKLGMVLGDVAGKGVSAALYMAQALGDFRHLALINPDPSAVLYEVNNILCKRARQGMFATAMFLLLDLRTKSLQLANAGHHPLLLRNREGKIESRGKAGGLPLGILPDTVFTGETMELKSRDLALLYTDGATEPTDAEKNPYGLERISEIMGGDYETTVELIERLTDSISAYTRHAPPQDDLTFLSFGVG